MYIDDNGTLIHKPDELPEMERKPTPTSIDLRLIIMLTEKDVKEVVLSFATSLFVIITNDETEAIYKMEGPVRGGFLYKKQYAY